ncbi:MAG: ECF-family polymerase sigma factor [Myxococcaceae bacterium]|nr:ECF-family polymerase sigma factor [Myxococcaceae bacterium]
MSESPETTPAACEAPPSPALVAALVAHRREFLGFLERRLGDHALAEDLLQDAFVRLDKLSRLRADESAVAWFYRVLRNAVIDHARRSGSKARALAAFAAELETQDPTSEAHATVCQCIEQLKDTLKPEYRTALERIELEGASVAEFASEAGISASNAGVRVFRARAALRKQVARACGSCAEHGCLDCSCAAPA